MPHRSPAPTRPGRAVCLALLGVALLAAQAGCRKETRVERAAREKILLLGNGAEPKALDPHIVSSVGDANILRSLFEGLVVNHPSDDSIHEPGVAERWEPNGDFSEWRFFLRDDARWSNGDAVTAHDFVYSFHRALHPETASPYSSMLYFLKNAEEFNTGKVTDFTEVGVKAIHDRELVCTLKSPAPYFPDVVKHTTWLPVHRGTIEKFGKMTDSYTKWQKPGNQVSNGAFVLSEWRINAHVKVRRNPQYWDAENVKLNGIDFYPIESPFTEEKAFRNGLIHYSYSFPENLAARYREMPDSPLRRMATILPRSLASIRRRRASFSRRRGMQAVGRSPSSPSSSTPSSPTATSPWPSRTCGRSTSGSRR